MAFRRRLPKTRPLPPQPTLPLSAIVRSGKNPRKDFSDLDGLTASIKAKGVIQPLVVTEANKPGKFYLLAGERRWRAAKRAGLKEVPVFVKDVQDGTSKDEIRLIENIQRQDLHPLELADALYALRQRLLRFGGDEKRRRHQGVDSIGYMAKTLGKKKSSVYDALALRKLIPKVRRAFLKNTITTAHALEIARCQPKKQWDAYLACFTNGARRDHRLAKRKMITPAKPPAVRGRTEPEPHVSDDPLYQQWYEETRRRGIRTAIRSVLEHEVDANVHAVTRPLLELIAVVLNDSDGYDALQKEVMAKIHKLNDRQLAALIVRRLLRDPAYKFETGKRPNLIETIADACGLDVHKIEAEFSRRLENRGPEASPAVEEAVDHLRRRLRP